MNVLYLLVRKQFTHRIKKLTFTKPYASSRGMAGSIFRRKMRSLRQGKAEESKGEEKPWFVLSFCSAHEQSCKYVIGNRVQCAPYEMHSYLTHVLFRPHGFAKAAAKQPTGLFLPPSSLRDATSPESEGAKNRLPLTWQ